MIFWIAGLFMLPRFYVYHQETTPGSAEDRAWIEREDRVRTIILTPAMLVVWMLGLMLAFHHRRLDQGWFHRQVRAGRRRCPAIRAGSAPMASKLAAGKRPLDGQALRIMNEIPGIAAALIVVLVIVRPF